MKLSVIIGEFIFNGKSLSIEFECYLKSGSGQAIVKVLSIRFTLLTESKNP